MTLYDEYRTLHPIAAEPSEFRDIVEAEVKRALEWMRGRDNGLPDSVSDWTGDDFKRAKETIAPLFDKITEYESLHYPIDEPSKEEAEAFRRKQEEGLPAEAIKPGRYKVTRQVTYDCNIRQGESGELWVRHVNYPGVSVGWSMPLGFLINSGATFHAEEEEQGCTGNI